MAGAGSGSTPATPSTRSSTKKAAAQELDASSTLTPTRKGKQRSLAAIARSSAAGKKLSQSNSSTPLHPALPRPPSWQQALAAQYGENTSPRRRKKKRTSLDERDPGDSVDSTEDELEDQDTTAMSRLSLFSPGAIATSASVNKSFSHGNGGGEEKQNICVCVRIRPSAPGAPEQEAPIWELDEHAGRIALSDNHPIMEKRKNVSEDAYDFTFDSLLLPPKPTSSMYEGHIRPVVLAAMEGYNGTIFSYGQTGSGKTHTMTGSDEEPGILPLSISDIFQQISTDTEREYLLRVSYLEIYNETLKDLLAPVKQKNLDLRLTEDNRGRIVVNNIKEEIVNSPQDVLRVLTKGEDSRSVSCTDWNQRSSRSHCVFSMIIESRPRSMVDTDTPCPPKDDAPVQNSIAKKKGGKVEVRISQLNLIDLAGSERATSQEERRKEGAFINKSLLSLSNVIHKLADDKNNGAHIPYRDSKLTRLLQTSLSGNARIAIVCTISPEARHGTESVSTLKFAQRAAKVITKAEYGVVTDGSGALLANLQETIANLQAQLARSEVQSSASPDTGALEDEKQARQRAEEEAREQRMKVIQLTDQIAHLQRQILTGTAEPSEDAAGVLRTPSVSKRLYGDLGSGSRPAGQRGSNRRLSELAFGLASPARHTGLPPSSSMRSISSALETIHSPNIGLEDDKIQALEKQLAAANSALEEERQNSQAKIAKVDEANKKLTAELLTAQQALDEAQVNARRIVREAEESTMTVAILREEIVACHDREEHLTTKHRDSLSAVKTQVLDLQQRIEQQEIEIRQLKDAKGAMQSEASKSVQELQEDLEKTRRELRASQASQEDLQRRLQELKAAETVRSVAEQAAAQKLILAEEGVAERDASIAMMKKKLTSLEETLGAAHREAIRELDQVKTEKFSLESQIVQLKRDHASEAAEMHGEYRAASEQSEKSRRDAEDGLAKLKAPASLQNDTIESLRAELEKKEQARAHLAHLKAANTPPDYEALSAKMQAVKGRSSGKNMQNSLGTSTSSVQAIEQNDFDANATLTKAELARTQKRLQDAIHKSAKQQERIAELELHIEELKGSILDYRQKIERSTALLKELGAAGLTSDFQKMSLRSSTPELKPLAVPAKVAMPLGAMSPHRASASSNTPYRSTGLSTPTKKDGHTHSWKDRPEPLPLPPGTPEWRKERRQTTEHEMNLLRSGGIASRTRTLLQSPRLERTALDWTIRGSHDASSSRDSPIRLKKGSASSTHSRLQEMDSLGPYLDYERNN